MLFDFDSKNSCVELKELEFSFPIHHLLIIFFANRVSETTLISNLILIYKTTSFPPQSSVTCPLRLLTQIFRVVRMAQRIINHTHAPHTTYKS